MIEINHKGCSGVQNSLFSGLKRSCGFDIIINENNIERLPMRILLTNDDGIFAPGLTELAKALVSAGHELLIAAPSENRSCVSHSLTLREPLYADPVRLDGLEGVRAYAVSGTPADCVRLAIGNLDFEPEVVVSGINNAPNLGSDAVYSGTVSAAIEGMMVDIPAIAVSKDTFSEEYMDEAAAFFAGELPAFMRFFDEGPAMLNVNVPSVPRSRYRGIRSARVKLQNYEIPFNEEVTPSGRIAYTVRAGKLTVCEPDEDTDENRMMQGYVVVTPLTYDITDYRLLAKAKAMFERDD